MWSRRGEGKGGGRIETFSPRFWRNVVTRLTWYKKNNSSCFKAWKVQRVAGGKKTKLGPDGVVLPIKSYNGLDWHGECLYSVWVRVKFPNLVPPLLVSFTVIYNIIYIMCVCWESWCNLEQGERLQQSRVTSSVTSSLTHAGKVFLLKLY